MEWNRFDICEAYYVYAMLWHSGQASKEYAIFGRLHRMEFSPRPSLSSETDLEDNARAIYDNLVTKGQQWRNR